MAAAAAAFYDAAAVTTEEEEEDGSDGVDDGDDEEGEEPVAGGGPLAAAHVRLLREFLATMEPQDDDDDVSEWRGDVAVVFVGLGSCFEFFRVIRLTPKTLTFNKGGALGVEAVLTKVLANSWIVFCFFVLYCPPPSREK